MDGGHDPAYSRAPEPDDVVRICRALNDAGARYVLIGGIAVIAHGAGRYTKDVDLLIDDAPDNVARVKRALSILPDNAARICWTVRTWMASSATARPARRQGACSSTVAL